jgi:ribosome-binding ATPase YchF (GTP1/OBG family)
MDSSNNAHVQAVRDHAATENAEVVLICAKLEAELVALEEAERTEFLAIWRHSSGVDKLIKSAYKMLG